MRASSPRRGLIASLLVLALFASFAIACTGGDTPEVQQPIHEERLNYETFLREIGVAALTGVPQPWITAPSDGDSTSGSFDVTGWSAIAKDVPTMLNGTATVRLYAVPQDVFETSVVGYDRWEVSPPGGATVDQNTREWKVRMSPSTTPKGQYVLLAQTFVRGTASQPAKITLTSSDGTFGGADTGSGSTPAKENMLVIAVMAQPKGYSFGPGAEAAYRSFMDAAVRYWPHVSHGQFQIDRIKWLTNGGDGYQIGAHDNDFGSSSEYPKEIFAIPEVRKALPTDKSLVSVIVFVPPDSDKKRATTFKSGYTGWSKPWAALADLDELKGFDCNRRGSFIHIPSERTGTLMHEIAHGLGYNMREQEQGTTTYALPDLYPAGEDYYGVSEYSDLDQSSRGEYFLMSNSGDGATISGFSQWWLGWLDYQDYPVGKDATIKAPVLSKGEDTRRSVPRIVLPDEFDGRKTYVVIEARRESDEFARRGFWKTWIEADWWPGDGVIAYQITNRIGAELQKNKPGWPRRVNWLTRLHAGRKQWEDPSRGYRLELADGKLSDSGDSQTVKLTSLKAASSATGLSGDAVDGAIMNVAVADAPKIIDAAMSSSMLASGAVQPDLDLHAYLKDGTHVGMNYKTGEYECPVEGAVISGDMAMNNEWILLPAGLAKGARFEVSSRDVETFRAKAPASVKSADLSVKYSLRPAAYSSSATSVFRGTEQRKTIAPGAEDRADFVTGVGGEPQLTPIKPRSAREDPLESVRRDPTVATIVASALMLILGVALLVWPPRRRKA